VLVDSYRFLPRSFLPLYENATPLEGESEPVWTPFACRLADATIALITSAGISVDEEQKPFDLDGERRRPEWGDPTHRVLPHALAGKRLVMSHLHVNNTDILADHNVALPTDVLDELVTERLVGAAAPNHVSVMGYQQAGLAEWRDRTVPSIVKLLEGQHTDGVVLGPV
jgi:hypothetical protein